MKLSISRTALVIGSAALLIGATVGISYAQSAAPAAQRKQAIIDQAASKLGVTGDQLREALKDARKEIGARVRLVVRDELTVAAKTLGLADARALRQELRGTTLTAVAQKHNVAPATVSNAIKADLHRKVQNLVNAGKLTAERAAMLSTKLDARADALITRDFKAK